MSANAFRASLSLIFAICRSDSFLFSVDYLFYNVDIIHIYVLNKAKLSTYKCNKIKNLWIFYI